MTGTIGTPILDSLGIPLEYVLAGMMGISVLLLIMIVFQQVKLRKINKRYQAFMSGKDAMSLEEEFLKKIREIDGFRELVNKHENDINDLREALTFVYSKVGIVKYDAFKEMGGKLSFALVLLNDKNDGFVMNSMHSREGCYTYIKEIIKGESYIALADEEKEALQNAINVGSYME